MIVDTMVRANRITPEEVAADFRLRASAPRVLPRLQELLSDGNSSTQEIVTFIRLDAGLVARVLQVANSAYFSKGVRCATVDEAVGRVGFNQIFELVSFAAAADVLARPLAAYGLDADRLWRMSVTCALGAERLAAGTGRDSDLAYTVALLHCVGMVAIDDWASRVGRTLALRDLDFPRDATEDERAALGCIHADVGATVLRSWDFPPGICEPVRWQYSPRASSGHTGMAWLLHVAKWIRSTLCAPEGFPVAEIDPSSLRAIGLKPDGLNGIVDDVRRRLEEVESMLESDSGQPTRAPFGL